jgi:class 3 adenylate cyclase
VQFSILGPIQVRTDDDVVVPIGGPKRRQVLSYLVANANRPVDLSELADAVSGASRGAPSPSAVRAHLTQLRAALGPGRLERRPDGWMLRIGDGELDGATFEAALDEAKRRLADGDARAACGEIEPALADWRGSAYADAGSSAWAEAERARLESSRVDAEELLLDAQLEGGQPGDVVTRGEALIRVRPEHEGYWARLLVGLYRSGRKAEALRAYLRMRREIGHEPSEPMSAIERAITFDDPTLLDDGWRQLLTAPPVSSASLDRRASAPRGVSTFLMTDIVGSTSLWETAPLQMHQAVARHEALIREAVESHGGVLVRERGEGDSTFSVFNRATAAAAAALNAQLYLDSEPWPEPCVITTRMAFGTGEASLRDGDWYGPVVNRVARLRGLAEPGSILVSQSAAEIIIDHLPKGSMLVSLGFHHLKNIERAQHVYELVPSSRVQSKSPGRPGRVEPSAEAADRVTAAPAAIVDVAEPGDPSTATTWAVCIRADREHYERQELAGGAVPDWSYEHTIILSPPTMLVGRSASPAAVGPDIDLARIAGDTSVSRAHARLEMRPDGRWTVEDIGSTNGTYVNDLDEPIAVHLRYVLEAGDRIFLGAWTSLTLVEAAGS